MDTINELEIMLDCIGMSDVRKSVLMGEIRNGLVDNINIQDLYEFIALTCISHVGIEPEIDAVATTFLLKIIYLNVDQRDYNKTFSKLIWADCLSDKYINYCYENIDFINSILNFENDKLLNFFGLKTLVNMYLLKGSDETILEAPQHLFLRVAIQVCINVDKSIQNNKIAETYYYLSNLFYTHATPTCINSGTKEPQLSSCYLMQCGDSIVEISKVWGDMAKISKYGGGIGVNISDIRGNGAIIKSNGGKASGILRLCKVFESIARYVNQRGTRNGSVAIFIEPWHCDISVFLNFRTIIGNELDKARDLFLGLWIPDYFMECVEQDKDWYLMTPDVCVGLTDAIGEDFVKLYEHYISQGMYVEKINANELFDRILQVQIETGMPYMMYKDSCNKKSNQQNLGTIKNSNLCVAPETYVLTDRGQEQIYTLKDREVNVWNGFEFSKVVIVQTGHDVPLIKINFSNGTFIECTEYHKFYVEEKDEKDENEKSKIVELDAKDLLPDMKIADFILPLIGKQTNIFVTTVENYFRIDDTFCFKEPKRNSGVFNGILTKNCSEIVEYSDNDETAVCNLASISLPKFVDAETKTFNFELLGTVAQIATENLNNIIDINYYPIPESKNSNLKHRPIGLGVQGLTTVYFMLDLAFDSVEAHNLNRKIFECIYYNSLKKSMELAKISGFYSSFTNSPFSKGILQFHMWGKTPTDFAIPNYPDFPWEELIEDIKTFGTRNSLLTSIMPTASTAQILGNTESVEALSSNIYVRMTNRREFIVANKFLIKELKSLNLWGEKMYKQLLFYDGSVQHLNIPDHLKLKYRTAFELRQVNVLNQSIQRGYFIDQSQSLNVFMDFDEKNGDIFERLRKCHFYGFKGGLKTGMYYLRSKPATKAHKFGIDPELQQEFKNNDAKEIADAETAEKETECEEEVCMMCSA